MVISIQEKRKFPQIFKTTICKCFDLGWRRVGRTFGLHSAPLNHTAHTITLSRESRAIMPTTPDDTSLATRNEPRQGWISNYARLIRQAIFSPKNGIGGAVGNFEICIKIVKIFRIFTNFHDI